MRKLLTIVVVLIGVSVSAQYVSHENRFNQSTAEANSQLQTGTNKADDGEGPGGPGNPGSEPVSINDYIPILILAGVFFIIVSQRKKVKTN